MNHKRNALVGLGILLFSGGSFINLFFSSNLLWGEMEARLYMPQTGVRTLDISCPLMIAPWETATINTIVTNNLATQATKPQVNAFVSHEDEAEVISETLLLEPYESQAMQWTVDSSNIIFDRLILVSILQRPYRNLESHQGTCSIYVYSLFGLDGKNTLNLIVEVGVLATLLSASMLFYLFRPFNSFSRKILQVNIVFAVLMFIGLVSALYRLWGLTLFFNATALLVIVVGMSEVLLGSKK